MASHKILSSFFLLFSIVCAQDLVPPSTDRNHTDLAYNIIQACNASNPNLDGDPGLLWGQYNGCYLSCLLILTGVLFNPNEQNNSDGYQLDPEAFHYLFEKEPLNLHAHTCLHEIPLANATNLCEQTLNFYGCIDSSLTMDLTSAIYNFYGTSPKQVFLLRMTKDFAKAEPTVMKVYNMTTKCSQQSFNKNGQSENCYNKCMWEETGMFDEAGNVKNEKFQNLFKEPRLNESANKCLEQNAINDPSNRCRDIEKFYECSKGLLTEILDESLYGYFGTTKTKVLEYASNKRKM